MFSTTVSLAPEGLSAVAHEFATGLSHIESAIAHKLYAAGNFAQTDAISNPEWTSHFKDVLTELGEEHGYFVSHSGHGSEWLFDLVWVQTKGPDGSSSQDWRDAAHLSLACEIEWKSTSSAILRDFLKLTFTATDLRLFVYTNKVVTHNGRKWHPIELCQAVTPQGRGFRYLAMGFPVTPRQDEVRLDAWQV